MSPVIGVIAASGIIKGLLALLTLPQLGALLSVKSPVYVTVSAMADSAFFFLPVLVGFAAAKRLGSDPMIAAVIGGFLVYPQMITWGKSMTTMFSLGSWNFQFLNYSYSIFPMILAAWLAKECEQWLKKVLPSYLQMIFTPLITILVVSTITLVITGPIIQGAANGIAVFINWLVSASGWVGGLIIGAFYQLLVIFGLHWGRCATSCSTNCLNWSKLIKRNYLRNNGFPRCSCSCSRNQIKESRHERARNCSSYFSLLRCY